MILEKESFGAYLERFNERDEETVVQYVSNAESVDWLMGQIPLFECPDPVLEETYYFRWWVYRKHVKSTPGGFVVSEFHPDVPWAGKYNAINCAVGHHLAEGRWLAKGRKILEDYIRFWFGGGGDPRSYSCWIAEAIWRYCTVTGDFSLATELLPSLVANYGEWERSNLGAEGLFWSNDDRDAMEFSISGPGLRPTLNSYLWADALAISRIARLAGNEGVESEFSGKAASLKKRIQERLWDGKDGFFKVIPLDSVRSDSGGVDFLSMDGSRNVREQIGFIPWYFNLPDPGHEEAWAQIKDPGGFMAPFGPTTAERRHPRFMFRHDDHECLWNGPSWPFATSQTLTAMANLLNNYEQRVVSKGDYLDALTVFAKSHYRRRDDGMVVSWLDENLDPFSGEWLSRRILENWGWPETKGGRERGKDYNHSAFIDLVITGLAGFRTRDDGSFDINPLVPKGKWGYFCLDNLVFRGRSITILYDGDGSRYGKGAGLSVFVDGKLTANSRELAKLSVEAREVL